MWKQQEAEKYCTVWSFTIGAPHNTSLGPSPHIQEDEMRGASETPGGFWWENLRGSDRYGKPVADGRNRFILKDTEFGGGERNVFI